MMSYVRVYIATFASTFRHSLVFRSEIVLEILFPVAQLIIQVAIWRALLRDATDVISLPQATSYALVSTLIGRLVQNKSVQLISKNVRDGSIAFDLLWPVNFLHIVCSRVAGYSLSKVVLAGIPTLVVGVGLYGISLPGLQNALLFSVCLVCGIIINLQLSIIVGLTSFWYFEIWHLERLQFALMRLLSGAWIPLWFFPEPIFLVLEWIPLSLIYFAPLSIFIEKVSLYEAIDILLKQIFWIFVLWFAIKSIWNSAISKLVIQGG